MVNRAVDDNGACNLVLQLPQLSGQLKAGLLRIEPGFKSLGNILYSVSGSCDKLIRDINSSSDDQPVDRGPGHLHDVGKIVAESLAVAPHCINSVLSSLDLLTACSKYLADLGLQDKNITKNANVVHAPGVQTKGKRCCNRVPSGRFNGNEDEIKALIAKLGDTTFAVCSKAQLLQDNRDLAQSQMPESIDSLAAVTKEAVAYTTRRLQSIGNQTATALAKAGDHYLKVSGIVSEMVVAIQYHDIARQQIEHVVSGMEDILSIVQPDGRPGGQAAQISEQQKGTAYFILTIQAAQLKLIITESRNVYDNVQGVLARIGKETAHLNEDVRGMDDKGITRFHSFQEQVETLYRLVVDVNELASAISKNVQDASSAGSSPWRSVGRDGDIYAHVNHKAVDAMITTGKTGCEDCGLWALSENRPVASAVPVGDCLGRILTVLEAYKGSWTTAAGLARDILEKMEKTQQHLVFFPRWINECVQVFESVQSLLDRLSPWKRSALELPSGARDDIAGRYTMESERRILKAMILENGVVEQASDFLEEEGNATDSEDNVELF